MATKLTGLIGRMTSIDDGSMTAKGGELTWEDADNNIKSLLNFVNKLGSAFNEDGTLDVPSPASVQIVRALMPFMGPIGKVIWTPCEIADATPALNGAVWLEANGSQHQPADYPLLAATYQKDGSYIYNAAGDDPAQFRLPDLRHRFLYARLGSDQITGTPDAGAGFGGEATHALTDQELPEHTHNSPDAGNFVTLQQGGGSVDLYPGGNMGRYSAATGVNVTAEEAHNNLPPYATGIFYILAGWKLGGAMISSLT
jgi:hypothetical protein